MSKLESIVPPVELCKLIPAGEFEDSALFWKPFENRDGWCVLIRIGLKFNNKRNSFLVPAPTLEEVLEAIREIQAWDTLTITRATDDKTKLATAALRRWFHLKGIEVE